MREHIWRFVLGLATGLTLGVSLPALAGISGGGGGAASVLTSLATDEIDADFTTTSLTLVDVTGLTLSATANANETWMVFSHIVGNENTAGNYMVSAILIDGTLRRETISIENPNRAIAHMTGIATGLAAGARIVKLQGRVTAGTGSWYKDVDGAVSCTLDVMVVR